MSGPRAWVVHADEAPLEPWDRAPDSVRFRTLLSGDRTPTDSLVIGISEVAPTSGDPRLHRHAQAEVYAILEGSGVVWIDGVAHPVRAGSTVFIPGGAWHAARAAGPAPLRLLYAFAADSMDEVVYEFAVGE